MKNGELAEHDHTLVVEVGGYCWIEHPKECGPERRFTPEVQDPQRCGFDWYIDSVGMGEVLGYEFFDETGTYCLAAPGRYDMAMELQIVGWETPETDYYPVFLNREPHIMHPMVQQWFLDNDPEAEEW